MTVGVIDKKKHIRKTRSTSGLIIKQSLKITILYRQDVTLTNVVIVYDAKNGS